MSDVRDPFTIAIIHAFNIILPLEASTPTVSIHTQTAFFDASWSILLLAA